tara:strand:+ start:77 stop:256 length:180 start_codon:yes stop_codon:yes gene_type:complete
MRIECKFCKKNLTGESIKLLEGKIDEIVCPCRGKNKAKELYYKQFDKFLATLKKYNDNY